MHTARAHARVLLVSANGEAQPYPVYPIALDYLREPLERAGHEILTWDTLAGGDSGSTLGAALGEHGPDVVLISVRNADNNDSVDTRNYLPELASLVGVVRANSTAPVVLGGSGYSLFPREIIEMTGADYGVVGPGEHVVAGLVETLRRGADPGGIPGLVRFRDGAIVMGRPAVAPPASPRLRRDPALLEWYWRRGGVPGVRLGRGCPHRCIYCTYPVLDGRSTVATDPGASVAEAARLDARHGIDQFVLVDSVANIDPRRLTAFALGLRDAGSRARWTGYFLPREIREPDVLLWREGGLDGVEFGVDTLHPELLRAWGKGFGREDVEDAVAACVSTRMPHAIYLILGGPGETEETLETTLAAASRFSMAAVFAFVGMRIYPGTRLREIAVREGVIAEGESLLTPRFFLSPRLDPAWLRTRLSALERLPNWLVVGRSLRGKNRAAERLRARGCKGALWQELAGR